MKYEGLISDEDLDALLRNAFELAGMRWAPTSEVDIYVARYIYEAAWTHSNELADPRD